MTIPTTSNTSTTATTVALSDHTVANISELLAMCEECLCTAGPSVHAELRAYLEHQAPPADPGWLIDMLGFTVMHLGRQLPAQTPRPREVWQEVPR